ncbi:hypothetical protein [Streptomyces ipomoeae]|uniref:Uncharacterized protein n=1 Tax=Streptomyces ipomoeae 91-03 TaxID=698759 RepID=L1KQK5_9ACTN|nr:hypothetical protein [Streptomyces ipomoeae]EKX62887.1 hypothetical protein STRIP9103_06356 [Streptomyces ipomoeae 91-03]MDX2698330.1 hypothetical protein [Streptomyces ipomoeae]MDX2843967.1 hypothetical protein [Streptomyces ipomoeae]
MPVEQHEDPFEGRLGDALRRAGDAFETDGHALVGGGAVRGRRMMFRRRAAMVGGVAGIALVGVGGTMLLPDGDTDGGGRQSVAAKPTGSGGSGSDGGGEVSGDELVRTLKGLLPKGKFSGESSRGTGARLGPYARVVYDDGRGGAAVEVGLGRTDADSEQARQLTTCPDKTFVEFDSCEESTLPDGSRLMLFKGYEYPDRRVDTKHWYAQLVTRDGYDVSVMEWNAETQKSSPITRDEPPLSTAQLKEIALDSAWREAIDAIPEEPEEGEKESSSTAAPGSSGSAGSTGSAGSSGSADSGGSKGSSSADAPMVSGDAIQKTLLELLPDGVDVVHKGGQETDFGYVVLDDGKGQSLVQINAQPGMGDLAGSLFGADAETLPDGTKVATQQGPGEKGGAGVVMWTVDTLRTDGLRVVISAFNSGAQHTAATRDTPALTMAQLKDIATSEKWKTLG